MELLVVSECRRNDHVAASVGLRQHATVVYDELSVLAASIGPRRRATPVSTLLAMDVSHLKHYVELPFLWSGCVWLLTY